MNHTTDVRRLERTDWSSNQTSFRKITRVIVVSHRIPLKFF